MDKRSSRSLPSVYTASLKLQGKNAKKKHPQGDVAFSDRLKALQRKYFGERGGMKFARAIGEGRSAFQRWQSGGTAPKWKVIEKILKVAPYNIAWLMGDPRATMEDTPDKSVVDSIVGSIRHLGMETTMRQMKEATLGSLARKLQVSEERRKQDAAACDKTISDLRERIKELEEKTTRGK